MRIGAAARIGLAEGRQRRHVARQIAERGIERCLNVARAPSMLRLRSNWIVMRDEPSEDTEVSSVTPAISPNRRFQRSRNRCRHDIGIGAWAGWR